MCYDHLWYSITLVLCFSLCAPGRCQFSCLCFMNYCHGCLYLDAKLVSSHVPSSFFRPLTLALPSLWVRASLPVAGYYQLSFSKGICPSQFKLVQLLAPEAIVSHKRNGDCSRSEPSSHGERQSPGLQQIPASEGCISLN